MTETLASWSQIGLTCGGTIQLMVVFRRRKMFSAASAKALRCSRPRAASVICLQGEPDEAPNFSPQRNAQEGALQMTELRSAFVAALDLGRRYVDGLHKFRPITTARLQAE
jgi:hypothetical protein